MHRAKLGFALLFTFVFLFWATGAALAGGYGQTVMSANVLLAPAPAACYVAPAATLHVYARQVAPVSFTIVPTAVPLADPVIEAPAPMVYQAPAVQAQLVQQTYSYAAPAAVVQQGYGYGGANFRQFNVIHGHNFGRGINRNVFIQRNVVRHRGAFINRNVIVNRQVQINRGVGRQVVKQKTVVRNGLFGRSVQKTVIKSR